MILNVPAAERRELRSRTNPVLGALSPRSGAAAAARAGA